MMRPKNNNKHKYNRSLCSVALSSALATIAVGGILPVVAQASDAPTGVTATTGRILYVGDSETVNGLRFRDLRTALEQAQSGDTIRLTSSVVYQEQNTEGLQINKDVTIDGQSHTLSIRASVGKGIDMHADLTLKNLTLSFTAEKAQAVINVGGNSLTIENVSTKLSDQQKDERPTIIGGKSDKEGAHTRITIIGGNGETRFKDIYAGDEKSDTATPVTIDIQSVHAKVDNGIKLGGKGHATTGKVTVETKSQNINVIDGTNSSDNHVTFTGTITGPVSVPNIQNITVEGSITIQDQTSISGTLELAAGANLTSGNKFSDDDTPITVGTLKGDGTIILASTSSLTVNGNVEGQPVIKVDATPRDQKPFVTISSGTTGNLKIEPLYKDAAYTFEKNGNSFTLKSTSTNGMGEDLEDEDFEEEDEEISDGNSSLPENSGSSVVSPQPNTDSTPSTTLSPAEPPSPPAAQTQEGQDSIPSKETEDKTKESAGIPTDQAGGSSPQGSNTDQSAGNQGDGPTHGSGAQDASSSGSQPSGESSQGIESQDTESGKEGEQAQEEGEAQEGEQTQDSTATQGENGNTQSEPEKQENASGQGTGDSSNEQTDSQDTASANTDGQGDGQGTGEQAGNQGASDVGASEHTGGTSDAGSSHTGAGVGGSAETGAGEAGANNAGANDTAGSESAGSATDTDSSVGDGKNDASEAGSKDTEEASQPDASSTADLNAQAQTGETSSVGGDSTTPVQPSTPATTTSGDNGEADTPAVTPVVPPTGEQNTGAGTEAGKDKDQANAGTGGTQVNNDTDKQDQEAEENAEQANQAGGKEHQEENPDQAEKEGEQANKTQDGTTTQGENDTKENNGQASGQGTSDVGANEHTGNTNDAGTSVDGSGAAAGGSNVGGADSGQGNTVTDGSQDGTLIDTNGEQSGSSAVTGGEQGNNVQDGASEQGAGSNANGQTDGQGEQDASNQGGKDGAQEDKTPPTTNESAVENQGDSNQDTPVVDKPAEEIAEKPTEKPAEEPAEKSIKERIIDTLKGWFGNAGLNDEKQQSQVAEKVENSLQDLATSYSDYGLSFTADAVRVADNRLNDLANLNDLESVANDNYAFLAQSVRALKTRNSVWVSSSLGEQRGDSDSKRRSHSINLGYDRQFDNLILGGFVSYLGQKGERGELNSKLHGYAFSLYGKYSQDAHEIVTLLNTGRTKADLTRNISALGINNQAEAKGKFVGLRAEYGYRMVFEQHALQVKPIIALHYHLGRQAAFTEQGTMPVHVDKIKVQRLVVEAGVELKKYFETAYVYVKPTIQTDLMARSNDVDIRFVDAPNSIPFKSATKKKTYFALSLGTQVQLRKNLLLDLNANSRIGNNERDIQGSVKLSYKF